MGEAVALRPVRLLQQRGGGRRLDDVEHVVGVGSRHCAEYIEVEVPPDDRCRGQGAMHVGAQTSDSLADDIADALRKGQLVEIARQRVTARRVLCDGARLGQVTQQLGDEERIAVRLAAQRVRERHACLVHLVAGRGLYQFEDLVVSQTTEVDPVHRRLAMQIGQEHGERMARPQVTRPVRSHDQAPEVRTGSEEVTKEREARGIGPLQVVQDDEDRSVRTGQLERGGDGLDQEELLGVRFGLHRLLSREKSGVGRQEPGERPGVDRRELLERGRLGVAHQLRGHPSRADTARATLLRTRRRAPSHPRRGPRAV